MKILLMHPPARVQMAAYFRPIGLASVAQHLLDAGHYVEILDLNAMRPEKHELPTVLPRLDFDMVGLSGLITTYKIWYDMMPLLRETYPKAAFVGGGGGITSAPEEYMNNLGFDIGVIGEGEYTAVELAAALENNTSLSDVAGLVYRDGELKWTPPRPLERDLDKIYRQAYHLLPMEQYARTIKHHAKARAELGILSTRGCPFNCTYCYHIFAQVWRCRSPEKVVDEIELLQRNWGAESLIFADECITVNKRFMFALCDEIINRGVKVHWNCFSRVDTIDEEMLIAMKKAGCWVVGYGIETGSQKILDAMNKGVTVQQMRDTIALTREYMFAKATMMYGYPGEDAETLKETVAFCIEHDMMGDMYFTTPYPGTKIFDDFKDRILAKYGNLHNFFMVLDDATKFSVNLTEMPDDEFFRRKYQSVATTTIVTGTNLLEKSYGLANKDMFERYRKQMAMGIAGWQ